MFIFYVCILEHSVTQHLLYNILFAIGVYNGDGEVTISICTSTNGTV